jgi:putative intracellular protease/amidase
VRILIVVTSHAMVGDTGRPTGVWLEELSTPYYAFIDAGAQVTLASTAGGNVPVDPHSLEAGGENPSSVKRFLQDPVAMAALNDSRRVDSLSDDDYAAVFLPGGHGTMWDLPVSVALAHLLTTAWQQGKVLAAVCHGPAGLVNVKDVNGQPLLEGRRVSAFSNTEEDAAGLSQAVPFMLESRLRELGAHYERAADFRPFALRDGRLVTGQNPASSAAVAQLVLQAIADNR